MSDRPHVTDERTLDAVQLTFDLAGVLRRLRAEETWRRATHDAMTLVKSGGLRVVLVAVHAGTVLPWHHADGPFSLQVLEGAVSIRTDSGTVLVRSGELLTLRGGVRHAVESPQDAAFLLTLATEELHPAERRAL